MIGDGQVTLGSQVIKPNARKVRKLKEGVICGFAGATADAMTLFERLEMKLQARHALPHPRGRGAPARNACGGAGAALHALSGGGSAVLLAGAPGDDARVR